MGSRNRPMSFGLNFKLITSQRSHSAIPLLHYSSAPVLHPHLFVIIDTPNKP